MRKLTYLAVFEPTRDGYSVYFPDLPGCVSFGKNFENAREQAVDALGLHVYGMEKDEERLPCPSDTPVIDPKTAAGFLVSPVTIFPDVVANEIDSHRVKVNVTIPEWVRELAAENGYNCSRLLEASILAAAGISGSSRRSARN